MSFGGKNGQKSTKVNPVNSGPAPGAAWPALGADGRARTCPPSKAGREAAHIGQQGAAV
ncbi:hypothetical protein A2U01_0119463, partial [Trifolium medium]|nr:hypothetical protein [Trifolium medium]